MRQPGTAGGTQRQPSPIGYTPRMGFEFAGATDVGRKRDHNEDALLVLPEHNVAVVCDGMGGHEAGEVASGIGVETVKRFFELVGDLEATWPFRYDRSKDEGTNLLSVAAQWANQRIREAGEADSGTRRGLGTTFVSLLVRGATAHFGWVGDSRGYVLRRLLRRAGHSWCHPVPTGVNQCQLVTLGNCRFASDDHG